MNRLVKLAILAGLVFALSALPAFADTYQISVHSSGILTGTQTLAFSLSSGGDAPGNNSATIYGFSWGDGSGPDIGTDSCNGDTGNCSGNLSSSVTLGEDATSMTALFTEQFDPIYFSFYVDLTNNAPTDGITPAIFSMYLCSADLSTCYSDNPDGSGSLLEVNLTGAPLSFDMSGAAAAGIDAPNIVPEPASLVLFGSGLLGLTGIARKRIRR